MNYQDTWEINEDGHRFLFTVEMKRKLAKAGLPIAPESLAQLEQPEAKEESRTQKPAAARSEVREPEIIQIDPETGKYIGCLKWYSPTRGYGFISRGGGEDIFFHKTSTLLDPIELKEGQWVLYDVEERPKGPEATEVEPYVGDLVER